MEEKMSGMELNSHLFEHIPHPVVAFNRQNLEIVKVNEAAIAKYGYSREEFYSLTADQLWADKDGSAFMDSESHSGIMGASRSTRHETKNGEVFGVEISTNNVEFEDVEVQLVIIQEVSDDVVPQKQVPETEQPVSLDKKFLYRITKNIPGLWALMDKQGRILHWNQEFEERLGYEAKGIMGRSILDFFEKGGREILSQKLKLAIEQGQSSAEGTFICKNGEEMPHVLRGVGFSYEGRDYMVGFGIDISERIAYQEQLEESYQWLQDAQELANAGSWQWNLVTNDRSWSDEACRILGYDRKEVNPTQEAFLNAIYPEDRPKVKQHIDHILENKPEESHIEYRVQGQHDGTVRYVKAAVSR
jgi:PAS domain S-box-containing protein